MAVVYKASVQPLWSIHQSTAVTGGVQLRHQRDTCRLFTTCKWQDWIGSAVCFITLLISHQADLGSTATVPLWLNHGNQRQQKSTPFHSILEPHRKRAGFFSPAGSEEDNFPRWVSSHCHQRRTKASEDQSDVLFSNFPD